jgi:hypothetical protein
VALSRRCPPPVVLPDRPVVPEQHSRDFSQAWGATEASAQVFPAWPATAVRVPSCAVRQPPATHQAVRHAETSQRCAEPPSQYRPHSLQCQRGQLSPSKHVPARTMVGVGVGRTGGCATATRTRRGWQNAHGCGVSPCLPICTAPQCSQTRRHTPSGSRIPFEQHEPHRLESRSQRFPHRIGHGFVQRVRRIA